jgi:hypothetical protein
VGRSNLEGEERMTDDDYDALSQKQLASIKRDMRISLEDAAVRATYKVMAELETEQEPVATLDDLEQEIYENTRQFVSRDVMEWMLKRYYTTPPQPERYITDAMKVRQAVAQALLDDVYAEELEQPEAKQSGTISITTPTPVAYLCENATGHKYFRWKNPSSVYKPIPLYTTPPQRTWVGLTDEEIDYYIVHRCGVATKKNLVELIRLCEIKLKEKNT